MGSTDAPPDGYISVREALKYIKGSPNFVLRALEEGAIKGKKVPSPKRLIWRVDERSAIKFSKSKRANHRRVGRRKRSNINRKPYINKGYTYVYCPDHPKASVQGYMSQHVIVMENMLGRRLAGKEEVHHINGNRSDNRPENLQLVHDRSVHMKEGHGAQYKIRMFMKQKITMAHKLSDAEKVALFDELLKLVSFSDEFLSSEEVGK